MFDLIVEKSKFFRIKSGMNSEVVSKNLKCPVFGEAFCGRIIPVEGRLKTHSVRAGESYKSVSALYGISEADLIEMNGNIKIYPTCKIFVPC